MTQRLFIDSPHPFLMCSGLVCVLIPHNESVVKIRISNEEKTHAADVPESRSFWELCEMSYQGRAAPLLHMAMKEHPQEAHVPIMKLCMLKVHLPVSGLLFRLLF